MLLNGYFVQVGSVDTNKQKLVKERKNKSQEMLEIRSHSFWSEAAEDFSFFALFLSEVVLSFLLFFSLTTSPSSLSGSSVAFWSSVLNRK